MELIGFAILIVLNFITIILISYFKKKGENFATKEDVEEITWRVESVKDEFVKDNEKLKAKLQVVIKNQQDLQSTEKETILGFLEECNKWLYDAIEVDVSKYYSDDFRILMNENSRMLNQSYSKARVAQAKLYIFIDNKEILSESWTLVQKILELSHITLRLIGSYRIKFHKYHLSVSLTERADITKEIMDKFDKFKEEKKTKSSEINKIQEELFQKVGTFLKTKNNY